MRLGRLLKVGAITENFQARSFSQKETIGGRPHGNLPQCNVYFIYLRAAAPAADPGRIG